MVTESLQKTLFVAVIFLVVKASWEVTDNQNQNGFTSNCSHLPFPLMMRVKIMFEGSVIYWKQGLSVLHPSTRTTLKASVVNKPELILQLPSIPVARMEMYTVESIACTLDTTAPAIFLALLNV